MHFFLSELKNILKFIFYIFFPLDPAYFWIEDPKGMTRNTQRLFYVFELDFFLKPNLKTKNSPLLRGKNILYILKLSVGIFAAAAQI